MHLETELPQSSLIVQSSKDLSLSEMESYKVSPVREHSASEQFKLPLTLIYWPNLDNLKICLLTPPHRSALFSRVS